MFLSRHALDMAARARMDAEAYAERRAVRERKQFVVYEDAYGALYVRPADQDPPRPATEIYRTM